METSGRQIQKIRCPGCGKEHDFAIWNSINTALEPELKEKVMNGSLFRTVCPHCGQAIDVVYPCLYHQVEEKRMIYYAPGEDAMREAQAAFSEGTAGPVSEDKPVGSGYINRVVGSLFDLQEKVSIFDAGLDDRVVEICKVLIGSELQDTQPDAVFDDLLYYHVPEMGGRLALMREGAMFASVALPDDVYREVAGRYRPLLSATGDDTVIDMEWVMRSVEKFSGGGK